MLIVIKKIETKSGEKGPFWRVESDQGWFTVFDQHLGPVLVPGGWDVEIETKGQYKHIITAKRVPVAPPPEPGPAAPKPAAPGGPTGNGPDGRDIMIARQVALKAAVEFAGYLLPKVATPEEITSKKIISTATSFEEYLTRPIERVK